MTQRVLIAGAGGLVASALISRFENVFALRHAALDIADADAVRAVCERVHPDLVVNCAVIGVDACEKDPTLAKRVNVDGPANLARAATDIGAAIVHFSSNYVFSGHRRREDPYRVDDETRPVNVYGLTKLEGERAVRDACDRAFIVRTSWVYGPAKDSFLSTAAAKLRRGERVQAIADTYANTTYVLDLANRVHDIVDRDEPGTFHVANDGVCSYEEFASEAAALVGAPRQLIDVVTEASMNRPAPRPACTPMLCEPPLRHWKDALRDYVRATIAV